MEISLACENYIYIFIVVATHSVIGTHSVVALWNKYYFCVTRSFSFLLWHLCISSGVYSYVYARLTNTYEDSPSKGNPLLLLNPFWLGIQM